MPRKIHCLNAHQKNSRLAELCRKKLDFSKPIEVYKNLHKDCWSIRQNRIVQFHTDYICLQDAEFIVSQAGRLRVLKNAQKNVHAFVRGFWCDPKEQWSERLAFGYDEVTYNPYKYDSFVLTNTGGEPVNRAKFVDMSIGICNESEVLVQFTA